MHRTAHFKTSAPEEWKVDAYGEKDVPGGEALARKLCAGVDRVARSVSTISQHSYYGWRFEFAFQNVPMQCVLNAVGEECHLTIEIASILPAWLLPPSRKRAFAACEGVFDTLLRQLPEITDIIWS